MAVMRAWDMGSGLEKDVYIMDSSTFLSASFFSDSDHSTSASSDIRFRY
jgi:hypothetical protein